VVVYVVEVVIDVVVDVVIVAVVVVIVCIHLEKDCQNLREESHAHALNIPCWTTECTAYIFLFHPH